MTGTGCNTSFIQADVQTSNKVPTNRHYVIVSHFFPLIYLLCTRNPTFRYHEALIPFDQTFHLEAYKCPQRYRAGLQHTVKRHVSDQYRQICNISRTLVGKSNIDQSDEACRRCSNCIFILHLTPGLKRLRKNNCKTRWETFKFRDFVWFILEVWRYSFQEE